LVRPQIARCSTGIATCGAAEGFFTGVNTLVSTQMTRLSTCVPTSGTGEDLLFSMGALMLDNIFPACKHLAAQGALVTFDLSATVTDFASRFNPLGLRHRGPGSDWRECKIFQQPGSHRGSTNYTVSR